MENTYEGKRYTYEQLVEMFPNQVVILDDYHFDYSDLVDGVLIGVCSLEERDEKEVSTMEKGFHYLYMYLYVGDEIFNPFMEVISPEDIQQSVKKPKPYIAPYSDIPVTKEELEKRQRKYYRLKKIGVNPTLIVEDGNGEAETENPYRIQAMIMINRDEEVPDELIEQIKKYDMEHNIKTKE